MNITQLALAAVPFLVSMIGLYVLWNAVVAPRLDDEELANYRRGAGFASALILGMVLTTTFSALQ